MDVVVKKRAGVVVWVGRVISAVPVLLMLFSASMKLTANPKALEGMEHFGYPERLLKPLGVVEVACVVVYVIPWTAPLGAILMTGYLGGAVATHLRVGEEQWMMPAALGAVAWLGLLLRDARLWRLLPIRWL